MPHRRSRSDTEQRFQDAVLSLVGDSGCARLGINAVAELAGADKVLIYRYFDSFEGLLQRVATSRSWLPDAEALCPRISAVPDRTLKDVLRRIVRHVQHDPATHQIARWRHAVNNPLTDQYTAEWKQLWAELPEKLSHGLDHQARRQWHKSCALLALIIQAELAGETVPPNCLEALAATLESATIEPALADAHEHNEYTLPTNLL